MLETADNINMTAGKVAGSNLSNDVLDNLTSKYGEMENKFPVEGVTCKRDINGNTGSYYESPICKVKNQVCQLVWEYCGMK